MNAGATGWPVVPAAYYFAHSFAPPVMEHLTP